MVKIAIIGGTGFSDKMTDIQSVETDYGVVKMGTIEIGGKKICFLARHAGLEVPHIVNYRANIQALKLNGIDVIIAVSACGRLAKEVLPGHLGIVTDVDWDDISRVTSFSEDASLLLHASMNPPFSKPLCTLLKTSWQKIEHKITTLYENSPDLSVGFHTDGTYFNIQGPSFSTPAREHRLRETVYNAKFIGQTLVPEVHLAREMGMSYAAVAMCVDNSNYPGAPPVKHADGVMHAVVKTADAAHMLLDETINNLGDNFVDLEFSGALNHALHESQVDFAGLRKKGLNHLANILEKELKNR